MGYSLRRLAGIAWMQAWMRAHPRIIGKKLKRKEKAVRSENVAVTGEKEDLIGGRFQSLGELSHFQRWLKIPLLLSQYKHGWGMKFFTLDSAEDF
jgi:hypothetical protein